MGQMRFLAPRRQRLLQTVADRAYMAGMDRIPWVCRNRVDDDTLIVEREIDESGNFYVPWVVDGHGAVVLSTTSLMRRDEPYHLPVELARGTLSRIREQLAAWESSGFRSSDELKHALQSALEKFVSAVTSQTDPQQAADEAERAIAHSLAAIRILAADYASQVLAVREGQSNKLPTLLGVNVGTKALTKTHGEAIRSGFNAVVAPFTWRDLEEEEGERDWAAIDQNIKWCRAAGLKVVSGPLLHLTPQAVPDWLYLWEDDFESVQSYVAQHIDAVVERYQGKVHLWQVAAAMNTCNALDLSDEHRLRLTVDAIDRVRRADTKTPIVVTFDQPWAEYLAAEESDLPPLHFADFLLRAGLHVAGIGLEINLGYWPGGTLPREMLEFSRLIDHWHSELRVPLLIMLTIPSSAEEDPRARLRVPPLAGLESDGLSAETQNSVAERLFPLLMSKHAVYGVFWNQLRDAQPHEFPHAGLFDAQEHPKPIVELLRNLRQQHLS